MSAVYCVGMVGLFLFMMVMLEAFDASLSGDCVMGIAYIACVALTIVGSERRRLYGRRAGLLLQLAAIVQAGVFCHGVYHKWVQLPDDIPLSGEDVETVVMSIVGSLFALVLGWGFGFSRRSRAWFRLDAPSSST